MTTGQLIRVARKKAGMTQAELAQKLGISYVGVSQWENGSRRPKQETLEKIADALEVDFLDLVPKNLREAYFAAYILRHPEITVEDYEGNVVIQGTGRTYNLSSGAKEGVQGAAIAADVIKRAGLTLVGENGEVIHQGDGKPWVKEFPSPTPKERIDAALEQLNNDGQEKAAERVEELTEISKYQRTTAPESTPAPQEDKDTTPPPNAPETPSEGK